MKIFGGVLLPHINALLTVANLLWFKPHMFAIT